MESLFYPAAVALEDGHYAVRFIDFPDLVATGPDQGRALSRARQVLQEHVLTWRDGGEALPDPTGMGDIPPELRNGSGPGQTRFVTLVEVHPPSPSVRVNITMDEGLLDLVDRAAQAAGLSRSGFLAMAARQEIFRPAAQRNCFAVMYEGGLAQTRLIHEEMQALGHSLPVRPGAWLLVTDKSHSYVFQALADLTAAEDTLAVQGAEALGWRAPDAKAGAFRALMDRREPADPGAP